MTTHALIGGNPQSSQYRSICLFIAGFFFAFSNISGYLAGQSRVFYFAPAVLVVVLMLPIFWKLCLRGIKKENMVHGACFLGLLGIFFIALIILAAQDNGAILNLVMLIYFCMLALALLVLEFQDRTFFISGCAWLFFLFLIVSLLKGELTLPFMGFFSNPNSLGLTAACGFLTTLLCDWKPKVLRLFRVFMLFFFFLLIFSSISRTAMLSTFLILVISLLRPGSARIRIILIGISLIFVVAIPIFFPNFFDAIMLLIQGKNSNSVLSGRDQIFSYYWNRIGWVSGVPYDELYPLDNTFLYLSIKFGMFFSSCIYGVVVVSGVRVLLSPLPLKLKVNGIIICTFFMTYSFFENMAFSTPLFLSFFLFLSKMDKRSGFFI